jgi:gliding motility-associated protein GldL
MALLSMFRTRQYRNFMAKLYGWGASVVIIGALFKINHYPGADIMLIIGLGTESLIFFFSAFEPPHVEPDWSLVYPQLAGIYHGDEMDASKALATGATVTQELDKMLAKAKIGPELIDSLGNGLRNLSETTSKLSNVSDASLANDQYVNTLKKATESAGTLSESYSKTAKTLDHSQQVSQDQLNNMKLASDNAASLSGVYAQVSESLKKEVTLNKELTDSISHVAASANKFVQKYNESTEILSKTTETLVTSASEGQLYNQQLEKVSSNLAALNAMYELHLQNSNAQMENTTKFNSLSEQLVDTMTETNTNTNKFKDNLSSLNKVLEAQLKTSSAQVDDSSKMHESVQQFLSNLKESVERTSNFKSEVDSLAKNIAALNKVYGNMLSAMNVTIK